MDNSGDVSILVCGISAVDVSIHFISCMLHLQTELARTPKARVAFEMFTDIDKALSHFFYKTSADVVVIIDTMTSVDAKFILHHDVDKPCVVATYPLARVDWDRVKRAMPPLSKKAIVEPIEMVGNEYNYDLRFSESVPGEKYVKIHSAKLKIFKMTRACLQGIVQRHAVASKDFLTVHHPGIIEGVYCTADEHLCSLLDPADLYADISATTQNSGPMDYVGCVGLRKRLR
jgi:hypothetical protein